MPPYKTIFIPAIPGTEEKHTFFSGVKQVPSDLFIDGPALAAHCEAACNALYQEGYEVVSVTEITRGGIHFEPEGGAGWSRTTGVLITARLRAQV